MFEECIKILRKGYSTDQYLKKYLFKKEESKKTDKIKISKVSKHRKIFKIAFLCV